MKEAAWNELMQVYTQILQSRSVRVSPDQTDAAFAALRKLQGIPQNDIAQLAQRVGGLPADVKSADSLSLYSKLERTLRDQDDYETLANVLEQTFLNAGKYRNDRVKLDDPFAPYAKQYEADLAEKQTALESPPSPGLLGRLWNAAVNRLSRTPSAADETLPEMIAPKEPPTDAQIEDAWSRLVRTYAELAKDYHIKEKMKKPMVEAGLMPEFFDKEKAKNNLISVLSHFQNMTAQLSEKEFDAKIEALTKTLGIGLPKGDYFHVFGTLRMVLAFDERKPLFVQTFSAAAEVWRTQEKQEGKLAEAWGRLKSVYEVAIKNMEDMGSINLLCKELRSFQILTANLGAEKLETKIAELTEKFGPLATLSSDKKEALLIKVGRESGGDKLLGLLQSTLRTPSAAPQNMKPSADQAHLSHK